MTGLLGKMGQSQSFYAGASASPCKGKIVLGAERKLTFTILTKPFSFFDIFMYTVQNIGFLDLFIRWSREISNSWDVEGREMSITQNKKGCESWRFGFRIANVVCKACWILSCHLIRNTMSNLLQMFSWLALVSCGLMRNTSVFSSHMTSLFKCFFWSNRFFVCFLSVLILKLLLLYIAIFVQYFKF